MFRESRVEKTAPVTSEESRNTTRSKKSWISPTLARQPANLAELTGGGTNDGTSCHS